MVIIYANECLECISSRAFHGPLGKQTREGTALAYIERIDDHGTSIFFLCVCVCVFFLSRIQNNDTSSSSEEEEVIQPG